MRRFRSSQSIAFVSGVLLLFGCVSTALLFWYEPTRVAARVCDTHALTAFARAYPAPGGYALVRLQATTRVMASATYEVDAEVSIVTGGFTGEFDHYPEQYYRATYSCIARQQGFWASPWQVQVTHISPLTRY